MASTGRFPLSASTILLSLLIPVLAGAEDLDSCPSYASRLNRAAQSYESAKSSFESACNPYYGYSRKEQSACGTYGYARSQFDQAKSELLDASSAAARQCGGSTTDTTCIRLFRETATELNNTKKKLANTEAELGLIKT